MKFSTLDLSAPIINALTDKKYHTPTPIQDKAIPALLNGSDVIATARTGTGKTAAYILPILEQLAQKTSVGPYEIGVLILVPTRELTVQVSNEIKHFGKYLDITHGAVYGGVNSKPQAAMLETGLDILVATPGRLRDLFKQKALKFNKVETFIIDESDHMLDMGFLVDIKIIANLLPRKRQTALFTATFTPTILELAKSITVDAVEINLTPKTRIIESIKQHLIVVDKKKKSNLFMHLIEHDETYDWSQVLVFCRTKIMASKLVEYLLDDGYEAAAIHSNKNQASRAGSLRAFKEGKIQFLVATDVVSRGIDIDTLPLVVNYELPTSTEDYIHRIGRTGRAGNKGCALSLVTADDAVMLGRIQALIKQEIPRVVIPGFEPHRPMPEDLSEKPRAEKMVKGENGSMEEKRFTKGPPKPQKKPKKKGAEKVSKEEKPKEVPPKKKSKPIKKKKNKPSRRERKEMKDGPSS